MKHAEVFTSPSRAKRMLRQTVGVAQREAEFMLVPGQQTPLDSIQADVVHVHCGVGSPLHTQGGQIWLRRTSLRRPAYSLPTAHQHDAQTSRAGAIRHHAFRGKQGKSTSNSATPRSGHRLHAVFIRFHEAVVVGVVRLQATSTPQEAR